MEQYTRGKHLTILFNWLQEAITDTNNWMLGNETISEARENITIINIEQPAFKITRELSWPSFGVGPAKDYMLELDFNGVVSNYSLDDYVDYIKYRNTSTVKSYIDSIIEQLRTNATNSDLYEKEKPLYDFINCKLNTCK